MRLFDAGGVARGRIEGTALGYFRDGTLVFERGDAVLELRDGKVHVLATAQKVASAAEFDPDAFRSAATGLRSSATYGPLVAFVVHRAAPKFRDRVVVIGTDGSLRAAGPLITVNGDADDANIGDSWTPDGHRLLEFTVRVGHRFEHETCLGTWTPVEGYRQRFCSERTRFGPLLGVMDSVQWSPSGNEALTNNLHVLTSQGRLTTARYSGENAAFGIVWAP